MSDHYHPDLAKDIARIHTGLAEVDGKVKVLSSTVQGEHGDGGLKSRIDYEERTNKEDHERISRTLDRLVELVDAKYKDAIAQIGITSNTMSVGLQRVEDRVGEDIAGISSRVHRLEDTPAKAGAESYRKLVQWAIGLVGAAVAAVVVANGKDIIAALLGARK